MVKANSFGLIKAHIMGTSFKIIFMDKASINGQTVVSTMANGLITRWKDRGLSHGVMDVDMKEIIKTIKSMDMEPLSGLTAESI